MSDYSTEAKRLENIKAVIVEIVNYNSTQYDDYHKPKSDDIATTLQVLTYIHNKQMKNADAALDRLTQSMISYPRPADQMTE